MEAAPVFLSHSASPETTEMERHTSMISFQDVSVRFDAGYLLEGLSLEIGKSEKVVILGRSGAGKSTLFHLLLGFLLPGKGRVLFEGREVDADTVWEVREKIAYVGQEPDIGKGRVSDLIGLYFSFRATRPHAPDSARIRELLDRFELERDVLDREAEKLSGGEKQRIALMIAVLLGRSVFLLDEATSGLERRLRRKIIDFFTERDDWTVVAVSHDREWIENGKVRIFDLEKKRWMR